jgi:succinoglycan biosynthesis protein ExoV
MKLHFHKAKNFGDALNPYVLNHFLPNFFDNDDSNVFVGFGTLLGFDLPKKSNKIIFSTGAAVDINNNYGSIPSLDETWDIICVRGPKTAKLIGIDPKLAVVDGAVLVKKVFTEEETKLYDYSFIPHFKSFDYTDYNQFEKLFNLKIIDPRLPVPEVIKKIKQSHIVICEAMHGAIVSDAFRIPWIPVKMHRHINTFKWHDWMESLMLKEEFVELPEFFSKQFIRQIASNKIKFKFLKNTLSFILAEIYYLYQKLVVSRKVRKKILKLKTITKPGLSDEKILNKKIDDLENLLYYLKSKYK